MADPHWISVRYFAAAADVSGCRSEVVAISPDNTLAELVAVLVGQYGPEMERVLSVSAFLVGDELTRDVTRPSGSAVDILPPFAGG
ncbi:MoaD/ThiS family protein [Rhodococcus sp. NPDC057135]|uniref:MoaD/ThiS family protein n=1 Tax=Rhodococcus sp. NPDC057135 TaxID=3346028 RepID=UPI00363C7FFB